jgi:hypothetical protein
MNALVNSAGRAVVFHAGALGDGVMIWPLLRTLARRGVHVEAVMPAGQATLAQAWVLPTRAGMTIAGHNAGAPADEAGFAAVRDSVVGGAAVSGSIVGVGQERPEFLDLWRGAEDERPGAVREDVGLVLSFVADEQSAGGRAWLTGASRLYPRARVVCVGPPGSASRAALWDAWGAERWGCVDRGGGRLGPVLLHVGAGGQAKRWPLERWGELGRRLRRAGTVRLVAGPVERECFNAADRALFAALAKELGEAPTGGQPRALAQTIAGARAWIGADTGPTHLAAQLGVPTLALFGLTDPGVWSPVGPCVRVLAPTRPEGMEWLSVDHAEAATVELLAM